MVMLMLLVPFGEKKIKKLSDPTFLKPRVTSKILKQHGRLSDSKERKLGVNKEFNLHEIDSPILFAALLQHGVATKPDSRSISLSIKSVNLEKSIVRLGHFHSNVAIENVAERKLLNPVIGAPRFHSSSRLRNCKPVSSVPSPRLTCDEFTGLLHRLCCVRESFEPLVMNFSKPVTRTIVEQQKHVSDLCRPKLLLDTPDTPDIPSVYVDATEQHHACMRLSRPRTLETVFGKLLTSESAVSNPREEVHSGDFKITSLRPPETWKRIYGENLVPQTAPRKHKKNARLLEIEGAILNVCRVIVRILNSLEFTPDIDQSVAQHVKTIGNTSSAWCELEATKFVETAHVLSKIIPTQLALVRLVQLAGWLSQ